MTPLVLDLKDLAKYPFLKESQEYVSKRVPSFEQFIQSNYGRSVLNRAGERVIASLHPKRDDTDERSQDPEHTLFSYGLARVIVSCIGERGITERHARFEAYRIFRYLSEERPEIRTFVVSQLGLDPRAERLPLTEYVELAASLREDSWRLVNRIIEHGSVHLYFGDLDELLRERIRVILQRQLPLPIGRELCTTISPVLATITASYQEQILQQFGEIDELSFPPCITALITAITAGTNIPHQGRFAITAFLNAIGLTTQEIVALYCRAPDFNVEKTMYQVDHITGGKGTEYTAPSCATMRTYGFCIKKESLCDHVNHPLNFYLIKKKKGEKGKEPLVPSPGSESNGETGEEKVQDTNKK